MRMHCKMTTAFLVMATAACSGAAHYLPKPPGKSHKLFQKSILSFINIQGVIQKKSYEV
jgi:hypothetical protein